MSDYIKREDAIRKIAEFDMYSTQIEYVTASQDIEDYIKDARFKLKDIPSADVVEVVRCKDCKWCGVQNEPEGTCYYWCRNIGAGFAVDEWNYCCWGERIEE